MTSHSSRLNLHSVFVFQNFPHLALVRLKQVETVKSTQRQQLSPNVTGTERTQQQGDKNADLQTQLHDKQKELEAAQEMVQLLRKGKKNLTDR